MPDYSTQIQQLRNILLTEFKIQKQNGKIDNNLSAYWSKVKKIMNQNLVSELENTPENEGLESKIETELYEHFKNQRFIAHTAFFINQYERKK
jgi:hypothetical protein